jgi:hypothetical protein
MSGPPVQQYIPPTPYVQPPTVPEKKGFPVGLVIVIVVIIAVVVILFIGAMFFFSVIENIGEEPWEEIGTLDDEVYIDEGGHYWDIVTDGWSDEFQVNITIGSIEGGPFDVYIMTRNQYDNAYGNSSTGAFSALSEWHNVTSVIDIYVDENPTEPLYLVIDNVEMAHVPGNAVPEGVIHVDIEVVIIHRFEGW